MRLPSDLALKYRKELESIEGELSMPYITDTEQLAKREGRAEGRARGRTEGQLQGRREAVLDALEARFGEIPYSTREAISHVGSDAALRKLLRLAVTAKSLDAFRV
jgi:flagellar biosynthesis/type III secretory pathway protein FliH